MVSDATVSEALKSGYFEMLEAGLALIETGDWGSTPADAHECDLANAEIWSLSPARRHWSSWCHVASSRKMYSRLRPQRGSLGRR